MNYLKHYIKLCRKCQDTKKSIIYTERHHIFPTSIYGKNLLTVRMNAKQHFIAHFLLWKAFRKRYGANHNKTIKMGYAFYKMTISSKSTQERYTSRSYQIIKNWYSENNPSKYNSKKGRDNPMFGKVGLLHPLFGIPCSEDRKRKIGEANKGKLTGNKNPSKRLDVRKKISDSWKRKERNLKRGINHKNYNSNLTEEIRNNLKIEWIISKEIETLYSFSKRNSQLYNVSMGAIQGVVYKSPNAKPNYSSSFSFGV